MRISLSKYCKRDNDALCKVYVRVAVSSDAGSEFIESHSFVLRECETNRPIAVEVFDKKPSSTQLRNYGKILFGALFSKDESSIARQQLQQEIPPHPTGRVLLELNGDSDLDAIPWEYTWVGGKGYLVHQCVLARVREAKVLQLPKLPLRIVVVIPDPVIPSDGPDASLPDLHLSDQFQDFINSHHAHNRKVLLERVFPPTVERMHELLMNKPETATALHFMGHCGKTNEDERSLIFEQNETGKPEFVDTSNLWSVPKHLRLAFLSACDTRDVARVLFEHGVPYTIGSFCSLPDDLARMFESKFYQLLASGVTVEMAMWRARVFLKSHNDIRQRDYFTGAMILYSSMIRKDDGAFECEEGKPIVQLNIPPNNLESIQSTATFCGRKKELVELNSALRRMTSRCKQSCCVYTIEGINGVGKTALAMEAMRRTAHLYPGGIFAWTFDYVPKIRDYFESLVEVMFSGDPELSTRGFRSFHGDVARFGTAIIKAFEAKPACLLFLDHSDILRWESAKGNPDAQELCQWIQRVASSPDIAVKILTTSNEPLRCVRETTMHLDGLIDSDIVNGVKLFIRNINTEVREGLRKETNVVQLLQSLVKLLDGHPLCLRFLASAINLQQYRNASQQEFDPGCWRIMLADCTRGSRSLGKCFESMIDNLPANQRLLLYVCSLFTGPITVGVIEFVCYFVAYTGTSTERISSNGENMEQDLQQLCNRGLLSKESEKYEIYVALREGARQCNDELKCQFRLPLPCLCNDIFVIGVVEPSLHGISAMLEWQLRNLQANTTNQIKNRTFGINYYYIGNAGSPIANFPSVNHSHKKSTSLQQASFRRLVVFIYKPSEGTHNSLSQFCIEQMVSLVQEKKLSFILCLDPADTKLSEHPTRTAMVLMKKAADALRAGLEKTHKIIIADDPSDSIEGLSTIDNSLEASTDKNYSKDEASFHKDLVDVHMNGKFVGRECELKKLDKLLNNNNIRYITIHGFGGMGKTSLALQAVRNFSSGSALGLSLVGTSKSSQVILKIARFLNIDMKSRDPQDQQSEVLRKLAGEEVILLFLDNMEDVKHAIKNGDPEKQMDARTLMRFFERMPINVKILATSRIALGWADEELVELDGLKPHDGMQVFRQWISHRKNDVDDDDAMKLSHLVHGHPLSLRLLGGVFNNCKEPIERFILNIQDRLPKASDLCSIDERHQSTNICFQYSFNYLNSTLRSFLRRLKVFEVPFTATLAIRILDHDTTSSPASSVADNLHTLWQHSWLNQHIYKDDPMLGDWRPKIVENDTEFYHLHPCIRDFLNDQFDAVDGDVPDDAEIQFYMALCYGVGFGVVNDLEKQIEYCTKAAKNGYLEAQLTLALCYEEGGGGVGEDEKAAFDWYLMAAKAGDRGAQQKVGIWYRMGKGVDKDFGRCTYWEILAEANTTEPLEIKFDLTLPLIHRAAACDQVPLIRSLMAKSLAKEGVLDRYGRTPLHVAAEQGCIEVFELLAFEFDADTNAENKAGETPLHLAAGGGHVELVKLLVAEFGADGKIKDKYGRTPLHQAAAGGHTEVVRLLVAELGADFDAKDNDGQTPLHRAILFRHIEVAKLLVADFGANIDARDKFGGTPLHLAASGGHVEVVRLLVTEFGADVNAKNNDGRTPLHQAAAVGAVDVARSLAANLRADVNAKDNNGRTPLHIAAADGHVEVVLALVIELGADVNAKNNDGRSPLHRAAEGGYGELVRLLVAELEADVNNKDDHGWTPVHQAAAGGYVEVVKFLVAELGADANATDNDGWTPLHSAVVNGHINVVRLLVAEFGVDVNAKDNDGWTPLHHSILFQYVVVARLLVIEFEADVNAKDNNGRTPLHQAISNQHVEVARLLVAEFGADENARDKVGGTLLHQAAADGHVEVVRLLLAELGANANTKNNDGRTPLHLAAEGGHVEVVRLLVTEFCADANSKTDTGLTPLHHAAAGGQVEVARLLVAEFGADCNTKDKIGGTPLHQAAAEGHFDVVWLLVAELGADVNVKNNDGRTPLHRAAESGQVELVRVLVAEFGADANSKRDDGWTTLHEAAADGQVEIVRLLIAELGADANSLDNDGWTPLHSAVVDGYVDVVRLLIAEFEADPNAKDNNGLTPLHHAAAGGHVEVARLLVAEFEADGNVKDKDGGTPLHLAATDGHVEAVKLFLTEFGADANAKNNDGRTPLHRAAECGHVEVVRLLVAEFGADANDKHDNGWTPLHQAAASGHAEVVRLLVTEFGADANNKHHDGWTPLHEAAAGGHIEVVKLLVAELGADVYAKADIGRTPLRRKSMSSHVELVRSLVADFVADVKNNHERTPLHLASMLRHVEVAKLLVTEFGVDVNAKDNRGWTPLHEAAVCGHIEVVRLLVAELGADVNAKANNGRTALHLASMSSHVEVVRSLVAELGADVNAKDKRGQTPLHLANMLQHVEIARLLEVEFGADGNAQWMDASDGGFPMVSAPTITSPANSPFSSQSPMSYA